MQLWQRQQETGMKRLRRKSPATILLALLLSFAQVQFALAAIVNTVTATGDYNGAPVIAAATKSVTVQPAAPNLLITKTGVLNDDDGTPGVSAGDTISYEIFAENTGNVTLTNVIASDPLLPGVALVFDATSDTDNDVALDIGEKWRWTGSYSLDQVNDIDSNGGGDGFVDNTVTIVTDQIPTGLTGTAKIPLGIGPAMTVAKSGLLNDNDGTAGVSAGDTITYSVTVTNSGNIGLTNVVVNDPMVTLTLDSGDLNNDLVLDLNEIWVFKGDYVLLQTDLDTNGGGDGDIDNTASVTSNEITVAQLASAEVALTTSGAMIVAKTGTLNDDDGTPGVSAGDTISYEITARNTGNIALSNVAASDPLLPGASLVFDLASDADTDGLLDVGEIWRWTGSYVLDQAIDINTNGGGDGIIENTVTINADEISGGQTATEEVPLGIGPSFTLAKSGVLNDDNGLGDVNAGDTITYTITLTNTGNVALTNVVANDPLVTLVLDAGDLNNDAILDVGEVWTYKGDYVLLQTDLDTNGGGDGDIDNLVSVTTNELPVARTAAATVPLGLNGSMLVEKTGVLNDDNGLGDVSVGDTITYTVNVTNTGNIPLLNVVVNDPLVALVFDSGDGDNDSQLDVNEIWVYKANYSLTQLDIDSKGGGDGNIENTVTVSSDQTPDQVDSVTVPLGINPGLEVVKTGQLNDDDGTPGLSAGDTISYSVVLTNTGNVSLTPVSVNDPMITLSGPVGDANNDGLLNVNETWTYTGTAIISQGDIDTLGGGDGDIDNTVTVTMQELDAPVEGVHELPIAPVSSMEITKTATTPVQEFPTVYSFDYQLTIRNSGSITQTNIRVTDDIAAAIAPAILLSAPSVTLSGFAGSGGYDVNYNGTTNIDLLSGDVQLAPGAIAVITISLTIDTSGQSINGLNTASVSSDLITTPINSDDPTQTPGDTGDVNPTPVGISDQDGDGSPDGIENGSGDRDGDGIADSVDYDPTGYFYCEADGRILSGGLITVQNLTSGGSLTGVGQSNGIRIVRDGSDGSFQFHALQPGTYRLSYVLPGSGVASTTRISSGQLDLSTRSDNPIVLGDGEFGSTGFINDFTFASNPFYTEFVIRAGDPAVFNNNIPVRFCGSSQLTANKDVTAGPTVQPDGSSLVTYSLTMTASGTEQVNDVQMVDNLDAVFGAGNYSVVSTNMTASPVGFGASIDPFYNGSANTALLTAGGSLQAGEVVTVELQISITGDDGVYDNTLTVSGTSPLTGLPVPPSSDNAEITISTIVDGLVVEKTALPSSAPIGGQVAYTITVRNPGTIDATGVEMVDLIPNGMTYVSGSARVDGTKREPELASAPRLKKRHKTILDGHDNVGASGRELTWDGLTIPAGGSVTITLLLVINASADGSEFINLAFARDELSGEILSNIAKARVRLEIEPVFQCSDIIGRVFDDLNKDGYFDEGEPGLPGVRLATPRGLLVTTDKFGRYSIACGAIPDADIGSNFIMKLDTRSLPTGYQVTSENPRVIRLTRGKLSKLNFAAANLREVRLELKNSSFKPGSTALTNDTLQSLGNLLRLLESEPSVLRIIYNGEGGKEADAKLLGRSRLNAVQSLMNRAWADRTNNTSLAIETRLVD